MKRSFDSRYVEDFVKYEKDSMSADFNDDHKLVCVVLDSDSDSEDPTVVDHELIKNPKLEGGDVLESCTVSVSKFPNSNGFSQRDNVNGVSETKECIIGVNANHDHVLNCTENIESSLFKDCSRSKSIESPEMRCAPIDSEVDCGNSILKTSNTNNNCDLNCTTNFFESSLFSDCLKSTNIICFGKGWAANVFKTNCVDGVPGLKNRVTEVESTNTSDAVELNCTTNFFESSLFLDGSKHSSSAIDSAAAVSKIDCGHGGLESGVDFPNDDIKLDCTKNFFESSLYLDHSKSEIITSSKMLCAAVEGSSDSNDIKDSLLDYDSDDSNLDYGNSKVAISSKFSLKPAETSNVLKTGCARALPFSNYSDIGDSQKKYFNGSKPGTRNKVPRHRSIDIIANSTKWIDGSNCAQTNSKLEIGSAKLVKNSTNYFEGSNPSNPTNDPSKVCLELLVETKDKNSMNMKLGSDKRHSRSIKFINNGHELDCIDGQNEGGTHDSEVDSEYSEFVDNSKPIDTNVSSGSSKSTKDVANDKTDCVEDVSGFSKFIKDSKSVCTKDSKILCSDKHESLITTSNCTDNADDSILDFESDDTNSSSDVFKIPYMSRTKNGSKRIFSVSNFSDSTTYFSSSSSANPTNDPTKVYLDFLFETNDKRGNDKPNYHGGLIFKPSKERKFHSGNDFSMDTNDGFNLNGANDISESIDGPNLAKTNDDLKIDCTVESSKFVNSSNSADVIVACKTNCVSTECVDDDSKVSNGTLATTDEKYFEGSNSANGIDGSEMSGNAIRSKCDNNDVNNFDVILEDSTKCNEESSFVKSERDPKETGTDIVSRPLSFINDSESNASNYYIAKKNDADVNSDTLECSDRLNSTDTDFNAPNSLKYINKSNSAKSDSWNLINGSKSARTRVHEKNLADNSHNTKSFGNINRTDTTYNTKTKGITATSDSEKELNGLNQTMANYLPNIDCSETISVSTKSIDGFKSSATNVVPKTDCANILSNLRKCSDDSEIVSESSKFVDETKSASTNSDIQTDCDTVSTDSTECVDDSSFLDSLISFDSDEGSMDDTDAFYDSTRGPVVSNSANINIHRKKYCNIGSDSIKNLRASNSANVNNDPLLVYLDLIDVSEDSDDSSIFEFSKHAEKDDASTFTNVPKIDYSDVVPESAETNSNAIDYEMQCPIFTIRKKQQHCPKIPHLKYEYCIPLLVQDIGKIKIGKNLNKVKSIYGINFREIMIYGQAIPLKLKFDTNDRIYSVDDGTGSVTVKYRHTPEQLKTIRTLDALTSELIAIKRERKTKRKKSLDKSQHDSLVKSMDILLQKCKKQSSLPMEFFTRGAKVSVIGKPYCQYGTMYVWATEMIEDSEPSRSKEIFFKQNLIRYYKEIYSEHRTD